MGGTFAQAPLRLTEGTTLEAELKGGAVHRYEVELDAGTYFEAAFDQQGGDVRAVIIGPDGRALYDYDGTEYGWEPAMIIAPVSGIYRLEARSPRAELRTGTYRLRVVAIRRPTADDEVRAHIGTLWTEAVHTFREVRPEAVRHARALMEDALASWQRLGDRYGEALTLRALRALSNHLDDFVTQLDYARREVEAFRDVGDDHGEADALSSICLASSVLGDADAAREACERSLALHRAGSREGPAAEVMMQIAKLDRADSALGSALQLAYDALAAARRLGDSRREADALLTIGGIHLDAGELEQAIDAYRHGDARDTTDPASHAMALGQIGFALVKKGDDAAAEPVIREAIAYFSMRGWRATGANMLRVLGEIYARRGDLEKAREVLEDAVAKAIAAKYAIGELNARRRLGEILLQLGRPDDADRQFTAASPVASALDSEPIPQALLVADRALVALARGDGETARRIGEDAVARVESIRGRAGLRDRTATLASSEIVYETLVRILMANHAADPSRRFDIRAFEISERARARSLLDVMMDQAADAPAVPNAASVDALRVLQRRIHAKAAALDRARATTASATASLSRDLDELFDQYRLAEARLARDRPDVAAVTSAEPLSADAIQTRVLDHDTVLVEYMVAEPASYAWVVSQRGIASYRLAGRTTIEAAVRKLQTEIAKPHAAVKTAESSSAATVLGRLLLEPVETIPARTRLLIVAPGLLQQVPFAALRQRDGARLVARHDLVHAPSASIVAAARSLDAQRTPAARMAAVFADPVFDAADPRVGAARAGAAGASVAADAPPSPLRRAVRSVAADRGGLTRLPFTRLEADAIASLVPRRSLFEAKDFSASLARATDPALANYRILHFATHGVIDTRTPELSGLVFSLVDAAGRPQDGFLRMHDISRLHFNADLVVLSGCETALGRTVEGEGTIGLTRAFVIAGARRVVASLWKVDDLATAEFMRRFYAAMLQRHLPPAAALAAAQREMAATPRWRNPYFWAGLAIQGEWR